MEQSVFTEKLNKVDGKVYVVEEEAALENGVYEGELRHDNIRETTVAVYTGPKLTGTRIRNWVLSVPSAAPWKRIIRVYAEEPSVYISYETDGDTVEAEDINRVQEALVGTQDGLNQEITRANHAEKVLADGLKEEVIRASGEEMRLADGLSVEVQRAEQSEQEISGQLSAETARAESAEADLQSRIEQHTLLAEQEVQELRDADAVLEEAKANKSDMDRELKERYTKSQVYTKEEVLQKIADLIGTAPDTLDTFKEIADALGNDPSFAATMMNILAGKVEKESGKGLSANDYSDEEKSKVADAEAKKHTHANKTVLDKLTQVLLDKWNAAYIHVTDTAKHITSAERMKWDTVSEKVDKESGKGLSANDFTTALLGKLNGISAGANAYVHPSAHPASMITQDAAHRFVTDTEKTVWNGKAASDHTHNYDAVYVRRGCTWKDIMGG